MPLAIASSTRYVLHESHFLHQSFACRTRTAVFDGAMAKKHKGFGRRAFIEIARKGMKVRRKHNSRETSIEVCVCDQVPSVPPLGL